MPAICSRLSNSQKYTIWKGGKEKANELPQIENFILVKGGSGIANKHVMTPLGVITEVSAEELKLLEKVPSFLRHKKNGYITVRDSVPSEKELVKIAKDLKEDKSKPLTDKDAKGNTGKSKA